VLKEPETRGGNERSAGEGGEQAQQDNAAWVSHVDLSFEREAVDPGPSLHRQDLRHDAVAGQREDSEGQRQMEAPGPAGS
jgi:hypothetical protein